MFTDKNLQKIDYFTITERIGAYALSRNSADFIKELRPTDDVQKIKRDHAIIGGLLKIFNAGRSVDYGEFYNFRANVFEAEKGIILEAITLYGIANSIKTYFTIKKRLFSEKYPYTDELFTASVQTEDTADKILSIVDETGRIYDSASPVLKKVRLKISETAVSIKRATDTFYSEIKKLDYSADDIVTVRDGYDCVAVKVQYKNMVKGVIIDYSQSGQTAFVVPERVFSLNSELHQHRNEELAEIRKILTEYTELLTGISHELITLDKELVIFDVYRSISRYAYKEKSASPVISDKPEIVITGGKHPLLGKDAVPLNMSLGEDSGIMVITGPNTGGKTVVIKTIALFASMTQTGIPIPAEGDSRFFIFDSLFIDIGDDQSIEKSLSTFSSHITNIKNIIDDVTPNSLVILDELGSGTDPSEGSSLAIAVIEYLKDRGATTIITTHYGSIKHYASQTERVMNASMEFDSEHYRPTYKLLPGIPGSSRALEISEKLGLKATVLNKAKSLLNSDYIKVEELIKKLENDRLLLNETKNQLELEINKYKSQQDELSIKETRINELETKYKQLLKSGKEEFLKDARKEFESVVRRIRSKKADRDSIIEGKYFIEKIGQTIPQTEKEPKKSAETQTFTCGDDVRHNINDIKGRVIEVQKDGIVVQFGAIKLKCNPADLEKLRSAKKPEQIANQNTFVSGLTSATLDVRGLTFDDASRKVDKFIEQAHLSSNKDIKILHGTGAGILRKNIHDMLKKHPFVESFGFEKNGNFSTNYGITEIKLK